MADNIWDWILGSSNNNDSGTTFSFRETEPATTNQPANLGNLTWSTPTTTTLTPQQQAWARIASPNSQFASYTPPTTISNQTATTPQLLRSESPLAFFERTQGRAAGGAGSGVGGQVAALQKSAENYWKRMQNYATARSQALGSAYSGLAGSTARQAASVAQGGLNTAAAIENIYANLAKDAAQLARGGGGMVTPRTATAGLVPVSGEMLAAQQEIPAAGASLANYLSDTMGVQAGALDALARSQAAYGTASVADFLDRFNVARLADERNVANQIAKLRAAAAARGSALNAERLKAEAAQTAFTQRANEWVNAYRLADPKGEYKKAVDAAAARFGVSPETVAAELANNLALRIQLVPGMTAALGS